MQDLSEVQEVCDEGYDDGGNVSLQFFRRAAILPLDLPHFLASPATALKECEDPEDEWRLGWTLKIQDESFPGQRSLQIGD